MKPELESKIAKYKQSFEFPDTLYKVGTTHKEDIALRFSETTAEHYGFRNIPFSVDYNAVPILSRWVTLEEGKRLEESFAKMIPRNVYTVKKYNGITECRVLTNEEVDIIATNLRRRFPTHKYGLVNKRKKGYVKFYFVRFDKKVKWSV